MKAAKWFGRGSLTAVLLVGALAIAAQSARADELHAFDPLLSLTGGCTVNSLDPVPDPGCPGGVHPPFSFDNPQSVTTDPHGNIYVASYGAGSDGRVDVFDAEGAFLTQVTVPGPWSTAVDSKGNLYVFEKVSGLGKVSRFSPSEYDPVAGEIEYGDSTVIVSGVSASAAPLVVNPANDHLFILSGTVQEYASADEGNSLLNDSIGKGTLQGETSLAIDASRGLLYVGGTIANGGISKGAVRVLELAAPHALLRTFDGADTPAGKFGVAPKIAVDEGTGDFFVYDAGDEGAKVAYRFDEGGEYLETIDHGIKEIGKSVQIWVDNGASSPNGALNPEGHYLFVPSHPTGVGHILAYGPSTTGPAAVEDLSVAEVTRDAAELRATIHPGSLATAYRFEYIPLDRFESEGGFTGATVAGSGQIPPGRSGVPVSAALAGLSAGTAYRYRVVAENSLPPSAETVGDFRTYPAAEPAAACSNDALRTGSSALLPDCRAYELVTPVGTNGRSPIALTQVGTRFASRASSPDGERVSFQIEGGAIPDLGGTGSYAGDPYLSTRSAAGWTPATAGPDGSEAPTLFPGSSSPDQGHSFWSANGPEGTAAIGGRMTNYVRYPDGRSELIGRGSLATDPYAQGKLISEDGEHIVFESGIPVENVAAVQLEPNAPPDGTGAVYDRTADEVTHVVSLLPGDQPLAAGQDSRYIGASLDGKGIAFKVANTLYLRFENEATYEIGTNVTFAGIAEGGHRIFYLEGGNLKAFDVEAGVIPFTASGDATPVNVASGGTAAYFVSPSVLTADTNPRDDLPQAGAENLYLSHEGEISFVATLTKRDVEGEFNVFRLGGLGLWMKAQEDFGRFGLDPSRTTPDGTALLFESRADLTGYESGGVAQVYRFDVAAGELDCLSCNPTGALPSGAGSLQSLSTGHAQAEPLNSFIFLANLRADGRRAFFQSKDRLVASDTDGLQDVYQWEAEGVGGCLAPGGCIDLISSGSSGRDDYLYAVSDSGDDVFILTGDLLLPASDPDETPSIYDARVGGGFPPPTAPRAGCLGEVCQPAAAVPGDPTPSIHGAGNVPRAKVKRRCPKGRSSVARAGRTRCLRNRGRSSEKGKRHRYARHGREGVAR